MPARIISSPHLETFSQLSNCDQHHQRKTTGFHSASELKQLFLLLGKSFDVAQVSRGALHGQFSLANLGSLVLLEIRTNQRLLLNGDRGPDCMSFCFEATGLADEHLLFNKPIAHYSLNGFRQGQKESHFQLTANTTTYLIILSISRFNAFISYCEQEDLIEQLEASNTLQITPEMHTHFRKICQNLIAKPALTSAKHRQITNYLYAELLKSISDKSNIYYLPHAPSPRQILVKEFVNLAFENAHIGINLDQISKSLFASRRTLIQAAKEAFGMGPMEMMKHIRLEQVNWILRSTQAREDARFKTITQVAKHYGFQSRGHFAKAYQNLFAETPSETWLKSTHR